MEYEDFIEEDGEESPTPEGDVDLEDELEDIIDEPRPKSPWKAFILTGFIASLIGAAGGGYGVYEATKRLAPTPAKQPQIDLSPLEAKMDGLIGRLENAETEVEKFANRRAPDLESLEPVDLSPLEDRLDALETAPSPEIDPEALTALKSAQEDGFDWPDTSDLETRLAELEAKLETAPEAAVPTDIADRLAALERAVESAQASDDEARSSAIVLDEAQISAIEDRLSALENRPEPAAKVERVSILAFPKAAMISAVEDTQEGGFMKKALSKHVRVKDDDAPLTLIEAIEVDISKGRLEDAAKKYDRLPKPVQAAGQAWYESVKASL